MHNPLPQTVQFSKSVKARFIKIDAVLPEDKPAKIEEIGIIVK